MASLLDRAKKVFAGNKFTRGPLQESWNLSDPRVPKFLLRGEGSRVFDEEGRSYVDYLCSFGATVLGYGDERVEAAAIAAARATGGQLLSCPTHYSVELAERLVKLRPGAEWVLLAKNGSDVTTLARVAARAATGRRGILREAADGAPAYHGASPQWLGGRAGVLSEESHDHEGHYRYNDLASVEAAIAKMGGGDSIAAIFVGAASYPYSDRTQEPTREFARGLGEIAKRTGALLVLDEIRTNFRVGTPGSGGSWAEVGGADARPPDLYCMCKAMANGHPIAALLGADGPAREGAADMTATGTYWLAAPPMAAALATLDSLEENDGAVIRHMQDIGRALAEGIKTAASEAGLAITMSGPPSLPFLTFDEPGEVPHHRPLSELYVVEMAGLGVLLHPHHHGYISAAHTQADVDFTLGAARKAMEIVRAARDAAAASV